MYIYIYSWDYFENLSSPLEVSRGQGHIVLSAWHSPGTLSKYLFEQMNKAKTAENFMWLILVVLS